MRHDPLLKPIQDVKFNRKYRHHLQFCRAISPSRLILPAAIENRQ
jgi:hypothetical protein